MAGIALCSSEDSTWQAETRVEYVQLVLEDQHSILSFDIDGFPAQEGH